MNKKNQTMGRGSFYPGGLVTRTFFDLDINGPSIARGAYGVQLLSLGPLSP